MMEGSATSASNLEWVVAELMYGEAKEARARGDPCSPCDAMVSGVKASESAWCSCHFSWKQRGRGLLLLHGPARLAQEGPHDAGRLRRDRLLPQDPRGPAAAILRPPARRADLRGAAKSAVWVQMFADVLGFPSR